MKRRMVFFAAVLSLFLFLSACAAYTSVTLDPAGGSLPGGTEAVYTGDTEALPVPERVGYCFAGWEAAGEAAFVARWEPLTLTVTFDLAGGETSTPGLLTQQVVYGGTATVPQVSREGYRFNGWTDGWEQVTGSGTVRACWQMTELGAETVYGQCIDACVELQTYDGSDISTSFGSGFLISPDGEIATAAHVIRGARQIEVRMDDGRSFFVTDVVAYDFDLDLAILKIDADNLPYLEISYDALDEGQTVYSIGSPNGRTGEMCEGKLLRYTLLYDLHGYLTTSLPLEGGSSGSPLLDARGRVIGVNVAMSNLTDESLAVKSEALRLPERVWESMEKYAAKNADRIRASLEQEPNGVPPLAQVIESGWFVRGALSGEGDADCYACEGTLNMMFVVSVDERYADLIRVEAMADGEISRVVENRYAGISGKTVLFYRTILSEAGVTAKIRISAPAGTGSEIPYSVRAGVFDAAQ